MKKAVITSGGTGGHVYPAVAVAKLLAQDGWETVFIGTESGIEKGIAESEGLRFLEVESGKFYRRLTLQNFVSIIKVLKGLSGSLKILKSEKPDVGIGFGGYVCAPAVLAAKLLGIKTALHEQNAYPGLANRMLSRLVDVTFMTFAGAEKKLHGRKVLTGLPVRAVIGNRSKAEAIKTLGLKAGVKTVAVIGGSQGGRGLNKAVYEALPFLKEGVQVVWMTGRNEYGKYSSCPGIDGNPAVMAPFFRNIEDVYAAADLAVIRAGASTVFEVLKCGLPSVLVPFPYSAADHQRANAKFVNNGGAGVYLDEAGISGRSLAEAVNGALFDGKKLEEMSAAARKMFGTDAGLEILRELKGIIC